MNEIKKFEFSL